MPKNGKSPSRGQLFACSSPSFAVVAPSSMSSDSSSSQPIDTPAFENKPTVQYAATVGLQAGLVGAFVSAVQNALGTHSKGASGFLSRSGGTIGFFGAHLDTRCQLLERLMTGSCSRMDVQQLPWARRSL